MPHQSCERSRRILLVVALGSVTLFLVAVFIWGVFGEETIAIGLALWATIAAVLSVSVRYLVLPFALSTQAGE